jgi:hypothetical protein
VIGYVKAALQDDVNRLIAVGIPLIAGLTDQMTMQIRIDDPTEQPAWFTSRGPVPFGR